MTSSRVDGSDKGLNRESEATRTRRGSRESPATTNDESFRLRRRDLLGMVSTGATGLALGAAASGGAAGQSDPEPEPDATLTVDNVSANAWEVTSVDGSGVTAETGVENPELSLRVGNRYAVRNDGGQYHPLAFRDANGNPLLSQSSQGSVEADDDVRWTDEDGVVSFTLTPDLAAAMAEYVCTLHSSMAAPVAVEPRETSLDVTATTTPTATAGEPITVTVSVERVTRVAPVNASVDLTVGTPDGEPAYSATIPIREFSGSDVQVTFPDDASDATTETGPQAAVTENGITIDTEMSRDYVVAVDAHADNAERASAEASLSVIAEADRSTSNETDANASSDADDGTVNSSNETTEGDPMAEDDTSAAEDTTENTDQRDGATSGNAPGFGIGSALAALGGVLYAVRRRPPKGE